MKALMTKAQKLVLLLGVTGVVFTTLPSQAEAGQRTILKSHGLTVNACRAGMGLLKLSGSHTASTRNGFLSGSVHLSSSLFGSISLTQGRWVGNSAGGSVRLNPRYVSVRTNRVGSVRVSFTKGFPRGKGTTYINFSRGSNSFTVRGLPRCG